MVRSLDHIALWVADRDRLAELASRHLGMHDIDRTETFTLIGGDARRGKLTLFDAEGPREPGVLRRVVWRVPDPDTALAALLEEPDVEPGEDGSVVLPEGLGLSLVAGPEDDSDLDHVVLAVPEPADTFAGLEQLGFTAEGERLAIADKYLRLERADVREGERPLLNHIAVLVDSAGDVQAVAEREGIEVDDVKDAANTLAVFLLGPDRIRVEYVEHKPGFALV